LVRTVAVILVGMLVLTAVPSGLQAGQGQQYLLREIEEHIERYYLYEVEEDLFPLESLDDLSRVFVDPHSEYLAEEAFQDLEDGLGRFLYGIGIYLEMDDSRPTVVNTVPGSPAEQSGLETGDIIEVVDGTILKSKSLEEVTSLIRGEEGTTVNLLVRRDDRLFNFIVPRGKIQLPSVDHSWIEPGIALVSIYNFNLETGQEIEIVLKELKDQEVEGVILDLRSNFGGYLEEALEVTSLLIDGTMLKMREKDSQWRKIDSARDGRIDVPVIVLLNLGTASAAEVLAAALKDSGNSLLVGDVSFGKGTIQTLFPLKAGGYLKLTTAEFTAPGGSLIEETGVEPHFLVFQPGEQVERALSLMEQIIQEKPASFGYLKNKLERKKTADVSASTPLPVKVEDDYYYPLRAVLDLTGRTIDPSHTSGHYIFYWDNIRYTIKLPEQILSWSNFQGESFQADFKLLDQVTYVSSEFLKDVLGLPQFPATD